MLTMVSAYENPREFYCLSTDTKPADVPNGSFLLEIDTGKAFIFDAENAQWDEV